MTLEQFEHAIRAAGAVLGVDEVLVVGSQALRERLGAVEDLEPAARQAVADRLMA